MVRLVNEGDQLSTALQASMVDTTLKERYFLTPNVYSQVVQGASSSREFTGTNATDARSRTPDGRDGKGWISKGKGKGKKGRGKKGGGKPSGLHDRAPDGRQICWKWNSPYDRCRYQCGRLHICQICYGSHPYHACKASASAEKDTAGKPSPNA
eukprot:s228_g25.t1